MAKCAFNIPDDLVTSVQDSNCTLFVGAGFSAMSGAPAWSELAGKVARRCLGPDESENISAVLEPPEILQICLNHMNGDKRGLVNLVRDVLEGCDLCIGRHHELLAHLPISTIFTTNYDSLIEAAFDEARVMYRVAVKDREYPPGQDCPPGTKCLGKLHGTFRYPDGREGDQNDFVLTEDDYEQFLEQDTIGLSLLKASLATGNCLFLGYSLKDRDFRRVHWYLRFRLQERAPTLYATMPPLGPSVQDFWRRRGVTLITVDLTSLAGANGLVGFLEELAQRVRGRSAAAPSRDHAGTLDPPIACIVHQNLFYVNRGLRQAREVLSSPQRIAAGELADLAAAMARIDRRVARSTCNLVCAVVQAATVRPECTQQDERRFRTIAGTFSNLQGVNCHEP